MVNSINTGNNIAASNFASAGSNAAMGKDDFLELLIAQLRNQDPLNPMDGTDFAAQLAQFSSLEQLANLNQTVRQSVDANFMLIQSVNNTMTANLIGKSAKLAGGTIQYDGQASIQFGYDLPGNAKNVTINIYDENGKIVKTMENVPKLTGEHKLSWDFTDNNGESVPKGNYRIEIEAESAIDGSDLNVGIYTYGAISGIKFTDTGTKILIDGIEYDLGTIVEIVENTEDSTGGN